MKQPTRYKIYLRNIITGEIKESLAKNHGILSKQEAIRICDHADYNAYLNGSPWRYDYKRVR